MNKPWTTCPSCGWNYELHGDTHMSTRFNCSRSRSTVPDHPHDEPVMPYAGPTCLEAVADYQQETIKATMAEQGLNFGPACDVFVKEHHTLVQSAYDGLYD